MRRLARFGLAVTLLGLPMGLVTSGCSDDVGGNEDRELKATKGVVAPDAPDSPEEYHKKHTATVK